MIRHGISVAIGVLLLAGAAWAQACYPQTQQYPYIQVQYKPGVQFHYPTAQSYNPNYNYGAPPGHYYCPNHRQYHRYDNSPRDDHRGWKKNDKKHRKHWKKKNRW